jgi:ankyrin repeat protein
VDLIINEYISSLTNKYTPLLHATENGDETIFRLLLKNGAHMDVKNNVGETPLSIAAENGHEGIVELLLAADRIDINSRDEEGERPLCKGCSGKED